MLCTVRIVQTPSKSFKVDGIIYYPRLFPFSFAFYGFFLVWISPAIYGVMCIENGTAEMTRGE